MTTLNETFRAEKQSQIALAYERHDASQRRIADYESGKTQAAMDAKLADQVASGKIRMVGPNRYEVLEGYDAGEYFNVQRATRPNEIPLILPEHGLDTLEDGSAALYVAHTPAWHELGTLIPAGSSDVTEVMRLGGIDYDQIVTEARFLWDFDTEKLAGTKLHAVLGDDGIMRFATPRGKPAGELRVGDGSFLNVRGDKGVSLGHMGRVWRPFDRYDVFAFLQELTGKFGLIWDSVGSMDGGRKVFITVRLPDTVTIDAEGIDDQIVPFLAAIDDRTGHGRFHTIATPWRIECANTERFSRRDAYASWGAAHTTNALAAMEEARRQLKLSVNWYDKFAEDATAMARADLEMDKFQAIMANLFPEPEGKDGKAPTQRQLDTHKEKRDGLTAAFEIETKRVGQSVWAGYNAVTDWLDHVAPRRATEDRMAAARATAVLDGFDDDVKSSAHRQMLKLVNR